MTLRVLSYNVYYRQLTPERMRAVEANIRAAAPDVFCIQECTMEWYRYFLEAFAGEYAAVGIGRYGSTVDHEVDQVDQNGNPIVYQGQKEPDMANPVFYRVDRFELLEGGTLWLSDTPETLSWSENEGKSLFPGILSYARLCRRSDGAVFTVANTHLYFDSESVRLIQAGQLNGLLCNPNYFDVSHPVFLTGDFNAEPTSQTYAYLTGTAGMTDARVAAADRTDPWGGTYNNAFFGGAGADMTACRQFDFCFSKSNGAALTVDRYVVRTDACAPFGASPSDHFPVYADYTLR